MKANDFDKLVKQKFDQNEFEYNPGNWDKLTERLDDNGKKPNRLLLLLPIIAGSLAASIAMAVVIPFFPFHKSATGVAVNASHVHIRDIARVGTDAEDADATTPVLIIDDSEPLASLAKPGTYTNQADQSLAIHLLQAATPQAKKKKLIMDFMAGYKPVYASRYNEQAHGTFSHSAPKEALYNPEKEDAVPTTTVGVIGGINYGSLNTGYAIGATAKRNLNKNLFLEGDVAIVNNSATSTIQYGVTVVNTVAPSPSAAGPTSGLSRVASASALARHMAASAKISAPTAEQGTPTQIITTDVRTRQTDYTLNYAQVTPGVGYNIHKRLSIGAAVDFQRLLQDDRPQSTPNDIGDVKQLPLFDVGFVGKTECSITKKIKAGVYYRQGINNVITPANKYMDRNYVQLQMKYNIFGK